LSKKSFKDNTANIDRFFSETPKVEIDTQMTHSTYETQMTQGVSKAQLPYYRINLKLRLEFKEYLAHESWKAHTSITEYINNLIQADKDTKDI